jgi:spectinomycin phosphotransferase
VLEAGQLSDWVSDAYGLRIALPLPVQGGADPKARLWRATSADGRVLALKTSDGGSPIGAKLMTLLSASGVPGVPGPLATLEGDPSSVRDGVRLTVLPWIESGPSELRRDDWASVGAILARVHGQAVTPELAALVPKDEDYVEHVLEVAPRTGKSLRHRLTGPGQRDAPVQELAMLWRSAGPLFAHLLDAARQLRDELPPAPQVLCHADPHKGNLLVDPSHRVWLLDWDDALLAPRERDLVFPLGGVGFFGPSDDAGKQAFHDGYGPLSIDPRRFAYYLALRALEDLGSWALDVCAVRAEETSRRRALAVVEECLSSRGIVTVAVDALNRLP